MTATDDRPTISERYSSATESSNLRVTEKRGDADLLIASGFMGDSLGALLLRLKVEFEGCDMRAIKPLPPSPAPKRIAILAKPVKGETEGAAADRMDRYRAWHADEAKRIAKDYQDRRIVAKALALVQLKSLREAKAAVSRFAVQQATKRKFMRPDDEVLRLVGQVLDVFLDPLCPSCGGRGFNGGSRRDEPQVICKPCRGTGHRKDVLGKDAASRDFGAYILSEMERAQAAAASNIAGALMAD